MKSLLLRARLGALLVTMVLAAATVRGQESRDLAAARSLRVGCADDACAVEPPARDHTRGTIARHRAISRVLPPGAGPGSDAAGD
jgi:hypothetical protein